jgi:hypothetical protein
LAEIGLLERVLSTLSTAGTTLTSSRGTIVDDGGYLIERDDENDRVTTYNPCRSFASRYSCLRSYHPRFNKQEKMRLKPIICNNDRLYVLAKGLMFMRLATVRVGPSFVPLSHVLRLRSAHLEVRAAGIYLGKHLKGEQISLLPGSTSSDCLVCRGDAPRSVRSVVRNILPSGLWA